MSSTMHELSSTMILNPHQVAARLVVLPLNHNLHGSALVELLEILGDSGLGLEQLLEMSDARRTDHKQHS